MKKIVLPFIFMIFLQGLFLNAQVSVSADGSSASPGAMLEVKSTDKGFLPPRMTTAQRNAISTPVEGLMIYNTDQKALNIFDGTSWTSLYSFVCGLSMIDTRDMKVYKTVQIGTQCWMAQNLNVGIRINGIVDHSDNDILEKYCYGDAESNCGLYGGLYQWDEMMQYVTTKGTKGICPDGWHIPSDSDWCTLATFLASETIDCASLYYYNNDAGGQMKETTTWRAPNSGASNSSGFTGLPGGYRTMTDPSSFSALSENGLWWSSTQYETAGYSRHWGLYYDDDGVAHFASMKSDGLSVRCIRD